ncbi:hypothetical protein BDV93DRAFT_515269 [Ceratobasidium sp. AG-I]|nr:hypothetical protein BDV93DRAFT_515269 [Ceratobasidium sp. AG-I]
MRENVRWMRGYFADILALKRGYFAEFLPGIPRFSVLPAPALATRMRVFAGIIHCGYCKFPRAKFPRDMLTPITVRVGIYLPIPGCIHRTQGSDILTDVARETGTREFPVLRAKIPANSRVRAASESAGIAFFARIPGGIPGDSRH